MNMFQLRFLDYLHLCSCNQHSFPLTNNLYCRHTPQCKLFRLTTVAQQCFLRCSVVVPTHVSYSCLLLCSLLPINQTARYLNPEGSNIHSQCPQNSKFHMYYITCTSVYTDVDGVSILWNVRKGSKHGQISGPSLFEI